MSEHKINLEKTYKFLFILYAPIAILSIFNKAFGILSRPTLYYINLIFLIIILITGIVLIISFFFFFVPNKKKGIVEKPPDHLKSRFLIFFICTVVLGTGLSLYEFLDERIQGIMLHESYYPEFEESKGFSFSEKKRVCFVIPLSNQAGDPLLTGDSQLLGIANFVKAYPEFTNSYHFSFIDSKLQYNDELERQILDEMKKGTKYFVCTFSRLAAPLSQNFEELKGEIKRRGYNPILLITDAPGSDIITKENEIYRFFVRIEDGIPKLIEATVKDNSKKAFYIAVDAEIGQLAAEIFIDEWKKYKGNLPQGTFISTLSTRKFIKDQILKELSEYGNPDVIFLACNNESFEVAVDLLNELKLSNTTILIPSGISRINLGEKSEELSRNYNVYKIKPKYLREPWSSNNLETNFMFWTLEKMRHAILESAENSTDFHSNFYNNDIPLGIKFATDKEGDFHIELEVEKS